MPNIGFLFTGAKNGGAAKQQDLLGGFGNSPKGPSKDTDLLGGFGSFSGGGGAQKKADEFDLFK